MTCEWLTLTEGSLCIHCGNELPRDYEEPPVAECGRKRLGLKSKARRVRIPPTPPVPVTEFGLGNQVESLLKSFGITQDRYKEAKAMFWLPATCGCSGRIEDWNEWGRKVSAWWRGLGGGVE